MLDKMRSWNCSGGAIHEFEVRGEREGGEGARAMSEDKIWLVDVVLWLSGELFLVRMPSGQHPLLIGRLRYNGEGGSDDEIYEMYNGLTPARALWKGVVGWGGTVPVICHSEGLQIK